MALKPHAVFRKCSMHAVVKARSARAVQTKRNLKKEREQLLAKLQEINSAMEKAGADGKRSE
jgi:uncharacterized protein YlxW (UPF0749 family)